MDFKLLFFYSFTLKKNSLPAFAVGNARKRNPLLTDPDCVCLESTTPERVRAELLHHARCERGHGGGGDGDDSWLVRVRRKL